MERFGGYNDMKRDYLELLRDGSPQSVLAMAAAATNRLVRILMRRLDCYVSIMHYEVT